MRDFVKVVCWYVIGFFLMVLYLALSFAEGLFLDFLDSGARPSDWLVRVWEEVREELWGSEQ